MLLLCFFRVAGKKNWQNIHFRLFSGNLTRENVDLCVYKSMKQTAMFVELMLHHSLGLIFCSEPQRAWKSCPKQASLWLHKNALLSLLQKQNLLFIQPPGAPSQGLCVLFLFFGDCVTQSSCYKGGVTESLHCYWQRSPLQASFCCHFHARLASLKAL